MFSGQQGFKTLTGKNFNAKNYVPNQLEKYSGFAGEGYDVDDDGNITKNGKTVDFKGKSFLKNQIIESFAINKQDLINQKKRSDAFKISNTRNDPVTGTKAIQDRINQEYANQMKEDGKDFSESGLDTSANKTGKTNIASQQRGYELHGGGDNNNNGGGGYNDGDGGSYSGQGEDKDWGGGEKDGGFIDGTNRRPFNRGGRAGYFFGGRVNYKKGGRVSFKNGGLASIL